MKYRIENSIVETDNCSFEGPTISHPAQYGRCDVTLFRSVKGNWYLTYVYNWCEDGRTLDYAEWSTPLEACQIILADDSGVPDFPELAGLVAELLE